MSGICVPDPQALPSFLPPLKLSSTVPLRTAQSLHTRHKPPAGVQQAVVQHTTEEPHQPLPVQVVADRLTLTEGAKRLIRTLRRMGFKTAILSGGFTYFAKHLQKILGFDYVYANELEIVDGVMTGRVIGEVVDAASKAYLLKTIAQQERIDPRQTIAVGDGANDLPMLSTAGLGVAFHAKPLVKKQAKHQISNMGLDGVLYLIGVSDRDVKMIQLEQDHYFSD